MSVKRPERIYGEHWPEYTERLEKYVDQLEQIIDKYSYAYGQVPLQNE